MSKLNGKVRVCVAAFWEFPVAELEIALAAKNPETAISDLIRISIPERGIGDSGMTAIRREYGDYLAEKRIDELRQLPEHSTAEPEAEVV